MAYEALTSLAFKLDSILDHQNICCFSHYNVETRDFYSCSKCALLQKKLEIQSIHECVVSLKSFLQDFPVDAADLDSRLTNAAKQAKGIFDVKSRGIFPDENDPEWKHICQELEKLMDEFDSLLQETKQIKSRSKRSNSFSPRLNPIVGFEEDLIEIKGRLCGEPSSQLEIIPIVGMGGIGKTTLARYTYHDPSTIHHFDVRAWVVVSQKPSGWIILSSLLSFIDPSYEPKCQLMSKEGLVVHGHRYLKKRRYLIVLDDMWDANVWDDVRMAFPDDCNGSRIIITTRDLDVASYIDSSKKPVEMQLVSVDQSWRLLKEKVFGRKTCPSELENIGKHIAKKCKGLPLAIVVIAGVLSKLEQKQECWKKIARNVSEAVNTSSDEQFSDILFVSYMYLPPHLRPCFLYTACFPDDYEISVSTLIRFWIAEDFLHSDESKDIEELGYDYLEDLARRNLVLIEKKKYNGKIKAVKIHDVLRDLCIRKSRDENFLFTINEFDGSFPKGIENSNRLSICYNISGVIPNMENSPIHTIILFRHWAFDFWKSFRLVRVVHALTEVFTSSRVLHISTDELIHLRQSIPSTSEFTSFESSTSIRFIGELIHLRYLALTCEPIRRTLRLVAESLYQLQNLQILIVIVNVRLVERSSLLDEGIVTVSYAKCDKDDLGQTYMKFEMWRMPQLRHLILLDGFIIPESSQQISPLENLHTLSRIQDFKCSEIVVQMIPNLKKLGLTYSYGGIYETGWSEYGLTNLVHLHKLEKLGLYAEARPNLKNDVLSENISFPVTLKKLTLSGCRFPWEDMTLIGSLPNLEVLKLMKRACLGTEWETSEGEFCQLKVLLIDGTDLHQWILGDSSFPVLERLTLYECGSLTEVPNGVGDIPTLELIEVDIRDSSVVASVKCIEEEQQSLGNDLLQVRFLKARIWVRAKDWRDRYPFL